MSRQHPPNGWYVQVDPASGFRTILPGSYVPWMVDFSPIRHAVYARVVGRDLTEARVELTPQQALDLARELIHAAGHAAPREP